MAAHVHMLTDADCRFNAVSPAQSPSGWLEVLSAAFPGITVEDCSILGEGPLSLVVQVGVDLVVRLPRHRYGLDRLRSEVRVLELMRGKFSIALPQLVTVGLDRPVGQAFVAHRLIPGSPVQADLIRHLPARTVGSLGQTVAKFLAELQELTPNAITAGVPVLSLSDFATALNLEVEVLLASRMTPRGRERARKELAGLASADRGHSLLCHSNLGSKLLYDSSVGAVGAIDFGSSFISDPVLDLASLLTLDRGLALAVGAGSRLLQGRLEDAALVSATYQLQGALSWARQENWARVDAVMERYY